MHNDPIYLLGPVFRFLDGLIHDYGDYLYMVNDLLSVVTCYFTMDAPADPQALDAPPNMVKVREHFKAALPYVEACLKLPKLKDEDMKLAQSYKDTINSVLKGFDGGG